MRYAKARGNGNCAEISLIGHFMHLRKFLAFSKMRVRLKVSISRIIWHQNLIVIYQSLSQPYHEKIQFI